MPTLLHGPGRNLGEWSGMPPSCALLGGFTIGARIALLWQHYGMHTHTTHAGEDSARRR